MVLKLKSLIRLTACITLILVLSSAMLVAPANAVGDTYVTDGVKIADFGLDMTFGSITGDSGVLEKNTDIAFTYADADCSACLSFSDGGQAGVDLKRLDSVTNFDGYSEIVIRALAESVGETVSVLLRKASDSVISDGENAYWYYNYTIERAGWNDIRLPIGDFNACFDGAASLSDIGSVAFDTKASAGSEARLYIDEIYLSRKKAEDIVLLDFDIEAHRKCGLAVSGVWTANDDTAYTCGDKLYSARLSNVSGRGVALRLARAGALTDFSNHNTIALKLYANETGSKFGVLLCKAATDWNINGSGAYYEYIVEIKNTGWQTVEIPLSDFSNKFSGSNIASLEDIQSINLKPDASAFKATTELYLDEISLLNKTVVKEEELSDKETVMDFGIVPSYGGTGIFGRADGIWSANDDTAYTNGDALYSGCANYGFEEKLGSVFVPFKRQGYTVTDFSKFRSLCITYCADTPGLRFGILLNKAEDGNQTGGSDAYWYYNYTVAETGWHTLELPLEAFINSFASSGEASFEDINSLYIALDGWGLERENYSGHMYFDKIYLEGRIDREAFLDCSSEEYHISDFVAGSDGTLSIDKYTTYDGAESSIRLDLTKKSANVIVDSALIKSHRKISSLSGYNYLNIRMYASDDLLENKKASFALVVKIKNAGGTRTLYSPVNIDWSSNAADNGWYTAQVNLNEMNCADGSSSLDNTISDGTISEICLTVGNYGAEPVRSGEVCIDRIWADNAFKLINAEYNSDANMLEFKLSNEADGISRSSFKLEAQSAAVDGYSVYNDRSTKSITVDLNGAVEYGRNYTFTILSISDKQGQQLKNYSYSFRTKEAKLDVKSAVIEKTENTIEALFNAENLYPSDKTYALTCISYDENDNVLESKSVTLDFESGERRTVGFSMKQGIDVDNVKLILSDEGVQSVVAVWQEKLWEKPRLLINSSNSVNEVLAILTAWKNMPQVSDINTYACLFYEQKAKQPTGEYATAESLEKVYNDIIILFEKLNSTGWDSMTKLITENKDMLFSDTASFNKYSGYTEKVKNYVNTELTSGTPYTSITVFRDKFDFAVSKYRSQSSLSGSGSSGGGGGSGSGKLVSSYEVSKETNKEISNETNKEVSNETNKEEVKATNENNGQTAGTNERFTDLSDCEWAEESINELLERGIVSMSENKVFRPADNITREEFVKLIAEAFSLEKAEASFSDAQSHWSKPYLGAAQKAGIINGMEDGSFGIGQPITRQDMVTMLYRTMKILNIPLNNNEVSLGNNEVSFNNNEVSKSFSDTDMIADYAREAVQMLSSMNIVNGMDDGSFAPDSNASRAQAAVVISRFLRIQRGE